MFSYNKNRYRFNKGPMQNLNLRTHLKLQSNKISLNYIQQNLRFQASFLFYWMMSFTFCVSAVVKRAYTVYGTKEILVFNSKVSSIEILIISLRTILLKHLRKTYLCLNVGSQYLLKLYTAALGKQWTSHRYNTIRTKSWKVWLYIIIKGN